MYDGDEWTSNGVPCVLSLCSLTFIPSISYDVTERGCALNFAFTNRQKDIQDGSYIEESNTKKVKKDEKEEAVRKDLRTFEMDLNDKRLADSLLSLLFCVILRSVTTYYKLGYQWVNAYYRLGHQWVNAYYRLGYQWVNAYYRLGYQWVNAYYRLGHQWVNAYYRLGYQWVNAYYRLGYQWVNAYYRLGYQWVNAYYRLGYQWVNAYYRLGCQ